MNNLSYSDGGAGGGIGVSTVSLGDGEGDVEVEGVGVGVAVVVVFEYVEVVFFVVLDEAEGVVVAEGFTSGDTVSEGETVGELVSETVGEGDVVVFELLFILKYDIMSTFGQTKIASNATATIIKQSDKIITPILLFFCCISVGAIYVGPEYTEFVSETGLGMS